MTRAHAGFTGVVQHEWLRPRGLVAPQRVAAMGIDTLPGVGTALAKRLRALGIEEGARVAVAHRGIFAGRDPIALEIGRMTVAIRRSHARAMTVAEV